MKYRAEIDGLRAFAVLPVIFFHAGFAGFSGGFVGVDVFFVISGYLITTILANELESGSFSIVRFYERRARRILPALFFVLLLTSVFAFFWLIPEEMRKYSKSLIGVIGFFSNILFWKETGYFDTSNELKPLLHTWSLSVEEQYYVFFPLLLMAFWRFSKKSIFYTVAVVLLVSLALAQWGSLKLPDAAFYLLPTRAWELMVGALAAIYLSSYRGRSPGGLGPIWLQEGLAALGLAALVYANFAFSEQTPFPGFYALVPTLGACLIILFASKNTLTGRFLSSRVFVGIGLVSYSAYLWHQPIFSLVRQRTFQEPSHIVFAGLIALTLTLSFLSWKLVEAPFRQKDTISKKTVFQLAIIGSAFFVAVGLAGYLTKGFLNLSSPQIKRLMVASMENKRHWDCWEKAVKRGALEDTCGIGSKDSPKTFAVFGDSHASAFLEQLDLQAKAQNLAGMDVTLHGCGPLMNSHTAAPFDPNHEKSCRALRKEFFAALATDKIPPTVVVSARWAIMLEQTRFVNGEGGVEPGRLTPYTNPFVLTMGYEAAMQRDYKETIDFILKSGRSVILVYPFPEVGWDVPVYLMKKDKANGLLAPTDGSTSYAIFKARNKRAEDGLDSIEPNAKLYRLKPEAIYCNTALPDRCAAHFNGDALYSDNNHLSNFGARPVATEISKLLLKLR